MGTRHSTAVKIAQECYHNVKLVLTLLFVVLLILVVVGSQRPVYNNPFLYLACSFSLMASVCHWVGLWEGLGQSGLVDCASCYLPFLPFHHF